MCVYVCLRARACVCPTRKPILSGIPSTQPSLHSQGSTLSDATVGWKIHNWNNNSNFIFLSLSATDRFCVLYQCVSASKSLKASWEVYYDTVRMYLYRNIYMYIRINATADLHCQVFSILAERLPHWSEEKSLKRHTGWIASAQTLYSSDRGDFPSWHLWFQAKCLVSHLTDCHYILCRHLFPPQNELWSVWWTLACLSSSQLLLITHQSLQFSLFFFPPPLLFVMLFVK